ncbi:hypothetical protein HQ529_00730 [Candidatus Woesearchaeota archaeon]|nr:hypothetical protein [Candidatus Woesearchaeota archaeon]
MEKQKLCPICGNNNVVYNEERDELICRDCSNIQPKIVEE